MNSLRTGQAVVLPRTQEAGGTCTRIWLAPRLTPHARHAAKYIDIPVAADRAFVFWQQTGPTAQRAHTLREFVTALDGTTTEAVAGHLRRGDFGRWIAEVFGDVPLARTVRAIEDEYRAGRVDDVTIRVSRAIRSRYDVLEALRAPGATS